MVSLEGPFLFPLLFLIYINDISDVSKVLDVILFADDTNIFFSHNNVNVIEKTFNEELPNLTDWCQPNKLSINKLKKTTTLLYLNPGEKGKHLTSI